METNTTLNTIQKRCSIRSFTNDPVSDDNLRTILDAANRAPSAHNQQSWRFIILRHEKKQGLAALVNKKAVDFPRPSSSLLRMASRSIISAPVVVAVANTGELISHGVELFQVDGAQEFFRTMEIQSSAAAVENLLLAATSLGIATVWLGILFLIKDDVLKYLEEPEGEFMAVIPVGYPASKKKSPKKKSLDSKIRYID